MSHQSKLPFCNSALVTPKKSPLQKDSRNNIAVIDLESNKENENDCLQLNKKRCNEELAVDGDYENVKKQKMDCKQASIMPSPDDGEEEEEEEKEKEKKVFHLTGTDDVAGDDNDEKEEEENQDKSLEVIAISDVKAVSKEGKVTENKLTKTTSVSSLALHSHKEHKDFTRELIKKKKEQETEMKRLKKEEEQRKREEVKRQIELKKEERRLKIEQERNEKKLRIEREKEERRLKLEKEKEERKLKLENEKKDKEEKRLREKEEKEKLRLERELQKKKEKEELEKKKQEEEEKKNKSQLKIASFFKIKKSTNANIPASNRNSLTGLGSSLGSGLGSRSGSGSRSGLGSNVIDKNFSISDNCTFEETEKTDYQQAFLKFFTKENSQLFKGFTLSRQEMLSWENEFDDLIITKKFNSLSKVPSSEQFFNQNKLSQKFKQSFNAFDVIQELNNSSISNKSEQEILEMLNQLPTKFIQFYENNGPPYCGTWTNNTIDAIKSKYNISLNLTPYFKIQDEGINYDYDSDLDWNKAEDENEEGEGEDINDEDEDEEDDDDRSDTESTNETSDLDEFVDDDKDKIKRRKIIGPLVPIIKIYDQEKEEAEEEEEKEKEEDQKTEHDNINNYFESLQVEVLRFELPIDTSKDYWTTNSASSTKNSLKGDIADSGKSSSSTPALPLTEEALGQSNQQQQQQQQQQPQNPKTVINVLTPHKKPEQLIKNDIDVLKLIKFIKANNDLSISTLCELTRKHLDNKNYTKSVVRSTIDRYFDKRNKKTWELKEQDELINLESKVSKMVGNNAAADTTTTTATTTSTNTIEDLINSQRNKDAEDDQILAALIPSQALNQKPSSTSI